ncbi:Clp protease N-terminal domain-containing protein [Streptomyces sp. NPDC020965]|uniref:Clp protease N-terminal domain-containing protein n=1 Tax=Streptomyces sp. NPDC020965 TaxID=3365105 RepID=UPI0037A45ADC
MTSEMGEGRMATDMEASWAVVGVLGAARGACGGRGRTMGTEHLLAAVADTKGDAGEALWSAGVTVTATMAVLRDREARTGAWACDDDTGGSVDSVAALGEDGDHGIRLTGAAHRAFGAAMELARADGAKKYTAEHLLRGLTAEENRAAEMLRVCRTSREAVVGWLDDGFHEMDDGLAPPLQPTRDALLGRRPYRALPFWKRWIVMGSGINWAAVPTTWVKMDAHDQARRLFQELGTEHVLLAILATYEVAAQYPHLAGENAPEPGLRYAGGALLAVRGVDYARVHRALANAGDLGPDERSADRYLDAAQSEDGTGPLAETLLREDTRARRLIESLDATP